MVTSLIDAQTTLIVANSYNKGKVFPERIKVFY